LGVPAYNFAVNTSHIELVQNGTVQAKVLQWLNDPNMPLGSAQYSAWVGAGRNVAPLSDRNAYQGATMSNGAMSGGGFAPNAIIKVSLPGQSIANADPATWDE